MATNIRDARVQVLVVGSGLVGLTAALGLSSRGVAIRVIERAHARPLRGFPIVLHARSVRLLEASGVERSVLERTARVKRISICQHGTELASLDTRGDALSRILTVEQALLRQAMLDALAKRGVYVEWSTRLTSLKQNETSVDVRALRADPQHAVLFPGQSAKAERHALTAEFVIGADGYDSTVRSELGLQLESKGPLEAFAFYVGTSQRASEHAVLELTDAECNSAYPLAGGKVRFTFQLGSALDRNQDERALSSLLARSLAGYRGTIESWQASGIAEFRAAVVPRFGVGRVWLAGDAAHMAPPIGSWSVNAGIDEACELAGSIAEALRRPSAGDFGADYDARRSREWRQHLSPERLVDAALPGWAKELGARLACSLPASGEDLDELLEQLLPVTEVFPARVREPTMTRS